MNAKKLHSGQSLIGVLIALAVMIILGQAIFTLTSTSYRLVGFNKARIAARHLGQERLEIIRNLPYEEIGTLGGIPSGSLAQNETVVLNGLAYTIKTSIVYVDDPFDDQAPEDILPIDYKRARIDVSWEGLSPSRKAPVVLVTDIAPRGIENTDGGGTLSILVFDSNANPVPQAQVRIQAGGLTPAIDLSLQTNDNGRIVLPGAPQCLECYTITATKENYSTDKTYSNAEVANPDKPLQSIIEGEITEISFAIDVLSSLNIATFNSRESGFSPLANTSFTLQGERRIGTDIDDYPVFKFIENFSTDENGNISIDNLEWDNYSFIVSSSVVSGSNPLLPIQLHANETVDLKIALSNPTPNSLLAVFSDGNNMTASVSAVLSNSLGFNESKFTGGVNDPDFGQVFFSNLSAMTYNLAATASGFLDSISTVNVTGQTTSKTILNPL
ncbi:hypothetical protein IPM62_06080 [Candidatus Woesebacteria bacterium]|nr:MAG: hypothetical protein IPM62_06080 [Candidatus Woesebacteria bacterium]